VANLAGGFIIGVAVEAFTQHPVFPPEIKLFVITGFLGSLTTFSTFSAESVAMLQRGDYGWASLHIGVHLAGSIVMTILGMMAMRSFGVQG
jgi:fluoride exporter